MTIEEHPVRLHLFMDTLDSLSFSTPQLHILTNSISQERGIIYWSASSVWTQQTEAKPPHERKLSYLIQIFQRVFFLTFRSPISNMKWSEDEHHDLFQMSQLV